LYRRIVLLSEVHVKKNIMLATFLAQGEANATPSRLMRPNIGTLDNHGALLPPGCSALRKLSNLAEKRCREKVSASCNVISTGAGPTVQAVRKKSLCARTAGTAIVLIATSAAARSAAPSSCAVDGSFRRLIRILSQRVVLTQRRRACPKRSGVPQGRSTPSSTLGFQRRCDYRKVVVLKCGPVSSQPASPPQT